MLNIKPVIILSVISAVITLLAYGFYWHNQQVSLAITEAVNNNSNQIKLELSLSALRTIEQRDRSNLALQEKVKQIELQKEKQMRTATIKYNSLLVSFNGFNGLSERSSATVSTNPSSDASNPSNAEATTGSNYGRLYREDAVFLADYARTTEELKQSLLSCYQQYDQVKQDMEDYEARSNPSKLAK